MASSEFLSTPDSDPQMPTISKEGFSAVSNPADAIIDVVFVHGLQGHPQNTWTAEVLVDDTSQATDRSSFRTKHFPSWKASRPRQTSQRIFWPHALLSKDPRLARARILTYGYDSFVLRFFGSNNQQNISRHGHDLMIALDQERKEDPTRPLLFVTHSLGGILVKVVLDKSNRFQVPRYTNIVDSLKGVIFLGTPHRGSNAATWGTLVSNLARLTTLQGSNKKVLKGLAPNSELLENLSEAFLQLLDSGRFSVHSFYETQGISGLPGIQGCIVPFESATIQHPRFETVRSINGNHHEVCKFKSVDDPGYKAVKGAILGYLEAVTEEDMNRTQQNISNSENILGITPDKAAGYTETSLLIRSNSKLSTTNTLVQSEYDTAKTSTDPSTVSYGPGHRLNPQESTEVPTPSDSRMHILDQVQKYWSRIGLTVTIDISRAPDFAIGLRRQFATPLSNTSYADVDWFFDDPNFIDWRESPSSALLQHGTASVQCPVIEHLWDMLEADKGWKTFGFDCSKALSLFYSDMKHSWHIFGLFGVFEILIYQLIHEDPTCINEALLQHPVSELNTPINFFPELLETSPISVLSGRLISIMLSCLSRWSKVYLVISGTHALGSTADLVVYILNKVVYDLLPNSTPPYTLVKIFIETGPRTNNTADLDGDTVRLRKDKDFARLSDLCMYVEKDKELRDCLQTLYPADYDARPGTILDTKSLGTYEWLKDEQTYQRWSSSTSSSLLLIQGKPGSGKSTVAKRIRDKIVHDCAQSMDPDRQRDSTTKSTRNPGELFDSSNSKGNNANINTDKDLVKVDLVAYFFYSFRGGGWETSHEVMLRSVLYQLLSAEPKLLPLFRETTRSGRRGLKTPTQTNSDKSRLWTLESLVRVVKRLPEVKMSPGRRLYLILDALDESDDKQLSKIVDAIQEMCTPRPVATCTIKAVMTTRPLLAKTAGRPMSKIATLSFFMEEKNRADIEKIVDREMSSIVDTIMEEDEEDEDAATPDASVVQGISKYIKDNAEGVFLWVDLVLKQVRELALEGQWSKTKLDQLRTVLPPKLMDIYQRITKRLEGSESSISDARRILTAMVFGFRRLSTDEMRDVLVVPSHKQTNTSDFIPNSALYFDNRLNTIKVRIRVVCGDLVEIKPPFAQMVHETVREFLLHKDKIASPFTLDTREARDEIAVICVRYLRLSLSRQVLEASSVNTGPVTKWKESDFVTFLNVIADRCFLDYVLTYLPAHLELSADKEAVKDEYRLALKEIANIEAGWYFFYHRMLRVNFKLADQTPHLASLSPDDGNISIGTSTYAKDLPEETQDDEAKSFRRRLITIAARHNIRKAIKPLIAAETEVDSQDPEDLTFPLNAAVVAGHTTMVKELILDFKAHNGYWTLPFNHTPLHTAAVKGDIALMKLIVSRRTPDLNYGDASGQTPLHIAAIRGFSDIVSYLLVLGADPNLQDTFGTLPLHGAISHGHLETVKVLLPFSGFPPVSASHPVFVETKLGDTSLHLAVENGNILIVEQLLKFIQENRRKEALYRAKQPSWSSKNPKVISTLSPEARLNSIGTYGGTPLHVASAEGKTEIVELLLKYEVPTDINIQDRYGWTPLDWAKANGHGEIVDILVQKGGKPAVELPELDELDSVSQQEAGTVEEGEAGMATTTGTRPRQQKPHRRLPIQDLFI